MSKESRERGLGHVFFSYARDEKRAKPDDALRRGRFVPDSQDRARLMECFRDAPRRMT